MPMPRSNPCLIVAADLPPGGAGVAEHADDVAGVVVRAVVGLADGGHLVGARGPGRPRQGEAYSVGSPTLPLPWRGRAGARPRARGCRVVVGTELFQSARAPARARLPEIKGRGRRTRWSAGRSHQASSAAGSTRRHRGGVRDGRQGRARPGGHARCERDRVVVEVACLMPWRILEDEGHTPPSAHCRCRNRGTRRHSTLASPSTQSWRSSLYSGHWHPGRRAAGSRELLGQDTKFAARSEFPLKCGTYESHSGRLDQRGAAIAGNRARAA
jgi:hypothetical protein